LYPDAAAADYLPYHQSRSSFVEGISHCSACREGFELVPLQLVNMLNPECVDGTLCKSDALIMQGTGVCVRSFNAAGDAAIEELKAKVAEQNDVDLADAHGWSEEGGGRRTDDDSVQAGTPSNLAGPNVSLERLETLWVFTCGLVFVAMAVTLFILFMTAFALKGLVGIAGGKNHKTAEDAMKLNKVQLLSLIMIVNQYLLFWGCPNIWLNTSENGNKDMNDRRWDMTSIYTDAYQFLNTMQVDKSLEIPTFSSDDCRGGECVHPLQDMFNRLDSRTFTLGSYDSASYPPLDTEYNDRYFPLDGECAWMRGEWESGVRNIWGAGDGQCLVDEDVVKTAYLNLIGYSATKSGTDYNNKGDEGEAFQDEGDRYACKTRTMGSLEGYESFNPSVLKVWKADKKINQPTACSSSYFGKDYNQAFWKTNRMFAFMSQPCSYQRTYGLRSGELYENRCMQTMWWGDLGLSDALQGKLWGSGSGDSIDWYEATKPPSSRDKWEFSFSMLPILHIVIYLFRTGVHKVVRAFVNGVEFLMIKAWPKGAEKDTCTWVSCRRLLCLLMVGLLAYGFASLGDAVAGCDEVDSKSNTRRLQKEGGEDPNPNPAGTGGTTGGAITGDVISSTECFNPFVLIFFVVVGCCAVASSCTIHFVRTLAQFGELVSVIVLYVMTCGAMYMTRLIHIVFNSTSGDYMSWEYQMHFLIFLLVTNVAGLALVLAKLLEFKQRGAEEVLLLKCWKVICCCCYFMRGRKERAQRKQLQAQAALLTPSVSVKGMEMVQVGKGGVELDEDDLRSRKMSGLGGT